MATATTTALTEFQLPKISSEEADNTSGTFVIEPLDKGFGYTFGNSLRRVLLSSLGGAAIKRRTKLEMYLTVGRGRGYSPAEDNKSEEQAIGVIPIDSIFSPIRRAAYSVDSARVGQRTDFDKLSLEIETDGSIEPGAALREAAEILIKSLAIFTEADRVEELTSRDGAAAAEAAIAAAGAPAEGDDRLIEELEIGVRAYNCLKRAGIQTIGDLVQK